jgi:predicted ATPase
LLSYAQQAVPTIKDRNRLRETRELGLFLREQGIQRRLFASELSDGTLRTLAMFLPLIDPRIPLVVVEEPENSIHPWVVRTFVDACRTCSRDKQIVLTTHSPVLVSKLNPSELYVAERVNGETRVLSATAADLKVADIPNTNRLICEEVLGAGASAIIAQAFTGKDAKLVGENACFAEVKEARQGP